jgi:hypothetical protein
MDEEDPPNIVDGNAAGFYYCEMATDTDGVVYNNIYVPAAGTNPTIPASPTPFDDPIVGGAGAVGNFAACIVTIPGGLVGERGIIGGSGYAKGYSLGSGATLGLTLGSASIPLPASGGIPLDGMKYYALGDQLQRAVLVGGSAVPITTFTEIDMTEDQDFIYSLGAADPDDVVIVTALGLEIDNR